MPTGMVAEVQGLIRVRSAFGVTETMRRLESAVREKDMTVFARIDHGAGARSVGLQLRPMEVLVFGNARVGTLLLQSSPSIGIDLPLKVLVWEDEAGQTWLAYQEPEWLAERHAVDSGARETAAKMAAALAAVAAAATRG